MTIGLQIHQNRAFFYLSDNFHSVKFTSLTDDYVLIIVSFLVGVRWSTKRLYTAAVGTSYTRIAVFTGGSAGIQEEQLEPRGGGRAASTVPRAPATTRRLGLLSVPLSSPFRYRDT